MARPFASVLIDTYNHERFVEKAIVSVLEQDFSASDREIVVVDDGSTDGTPDIVRKFESSVRLLRKPNGGQASAFNVGIPECKGEVVAFLDGDDWWAPGKLRAVCDTLAADTAVGLVGHGIVIRHPDGRLQTDTLNAGHRFSANNLVDARLFRLRKSFLGTSRMTIRTELLRRIGTVPATLTIQADEYLFTLAAALSSAVILPEALTFYRLHDANLFHMATRDPFKMRAKYAALHSLAKSLAQGLAVHQIDPQVNQMIAEAVQAEADQLRLEIEGGWPWETVHVEWLAYRILHPEVSLGNRMLKLASLFPALFLTPRAFYRVRQKFAQSYLYLQFRKRWLPAPKLPHVSTEWRPGA